jgi:hypothetical protein
LNAPIFKRLVHLALSAQQNKAILTVVLFEKGFKIHYNVPMLCAGPAKTVEAHCEALCSNITKFSIESPLAGLALSICYAQVIGGNPP